MIESSVVKNNTPHKALQPYISEYVFRSITLCKDQSIVKAMPLRVTSSIDFFLGNRFETLHCKTNDPQIFNRCTIRGPRTHKKYSIVISEDFVSFTIKFKPAGLYRLLGIPANTFCDQAIDGQLLYAGIFPEITERLMGCKNIQECITIVESYLLRLVFKQRKIYASKAIDEMISLISMDRIPANITGFFKEVSSSTRQLERNFIKEIGTTPKLYCNMVRFENLLKHKKDFPEKKWSTLAYEFNYYDQMHLIKNFQSFLDINPGNFIPENYAL